MGHRLRYPPAVPRATHPSGAAIYNPDGDYAFNLTGAVLQGNLRVCEQIRCGGLFRLDRAQAAGMVT